MWFFVGTGVTVALAGAATWSGLDTSSKHDDFLGGACDRSTSEGCEALSSDGKDAQLRTNILLGAAAVTGVATAVMGVFFVRWRGEKRASPSMAIAPGPGSATFRMTF